MHSRDSSRARELLGVTPGAATDAVVTEARDSRGGQDVGAANRLGGPHRTHRCRRASRTVIRAVHEGSITNRNKSQHNSDKKSGFRSACRGQTSEISVRMRAALADPAPVGSLSDKPVGPASRDRSKRSAPVRSRNTVHPAPQTSTAPVCGNCSPKTSGAMVSKVPASPVGSSEITAHQPKSAILIVSHARERSKLSALISL
mmetsp:Transcript_61607/g.163916  ORF Transcript_61607/g.163916 Transcript_61607/m.163916 type:complete len:202 (+) Transcript_61607:919-1524(+)